MSPTRTLIPRLNEASIENSPSKHSPSKLELSSQINAKIR